MSSSKDYLPDLESARKIIQSLQDHLQTLDIKLLTFDAPIIDRTGGKWNQDDLLGFKKFNEAVLHQADLLDSMIASGVSPKESPLPGAQGLNTFYKLVLNARPPIAALRTTMKGKAKDEGFIDIIAKGGKEWIRIYSKKTTQLLAEFREADSYCNSDYDSDSDPESEPSTTSLGSSSKLPIIKERLAPGLDNSLYQTAKSLLTLLQTTDRVPNTQPPRLCLHLSRISPDANEDPRLQLTFTRIRNLGVKLTFGDLSEIPLEPKWGRPGGLKVAKRINLDPTALMGLCSDLLHYPLPPDLPSARARFFRPKECLVVPSGKRWGKHLKKRGLHGTEVDEDEDQSQNSKELYKNIVEEMDIPLIEEIRGVLEGSECGYGEGDVEFWATVDAVKYMKEALGGEVEGDTSEQRRMRRLIGEEQGDFWQGSRYEGIKGVLKGLKLRIFNNEDEAPNKDKEIGNLPLPTGFHESLRDITGSFLEAHDNRHQTRTTHLPAFLKPQRLPLPKVAKLSLPFPIVSLGSLKRGAEEGMTTLMMGNIVLREVFASNQWKVKGWVQGDYSDEELGEASGERTAAVWMLPYRSLGEAKRVKFGKGDYSYPTKV